MNAKPGSLRLEISQIYSNQTNLRHWRRYIINDKIHGQLVVIHVKKTYNCHIMSHECIRVFRAYFVVLILWS